MEHYFTDGTEPTIMPHIHCSGPCNQGRKPCPAPAACERVDVDGAEGEYLGAIVLAVIACGVSVVLVV